MSTDKAILDAARILRRGGLVAIPTETVYGLAADATNPKAVARIFATKGRPGFNPLICHVPAPEDAARIARISPLADRLITAFWPGPLTLVLPQRPDSPLADLVSAGLPSVGIRMPAHPMALALLRQTGRPLAAPSANRSGAISPTTARHVADDLGKDVDMILDGGPCSLGLESTIIGLPDDGTDRLLLLRPGGITPDQIAEICGIRPEADQSGAITAPGQLLSHYAPRGQLRLDAIRAGDGEFMIGFGAIGGDLNLSPKGDLIEAAAGLFAALRQADDSGASGLAIAPIPDHGLGLAINDRLRRAAAPRPAKSDKGRAAAPRPADSERD
ncbi:threonylcarbamoyl-AMP synthase [Iodidimonas nitroreducens]|uniref:Threonylcarbamoyl-AMP synthase n=1 Tax=Iodidimonas nitroreducens TaxID=1236968 RepID=A0A5A7N5N2_9PROT|nr:L-threonylcarbamoyladenylate synthase [Iodidimonas nitroreducens]GAK33656.1 threonylcarbamoyl-AMP synthase [alpha proteobacterium Q-1]GER03633.1 threonylcarbamoyl-AMP synthase [Iodidimonas nitroreducens]